MDPAEHFMKMRALQRTESVALVSQTVDRRRKRRHCPMPLTLAPR